MGGTDRSPPTRSPLAAAAVDHVLLSYHYLDEGDLDGYGSLLAEDARLIRPGLPSAVGRTRVLAVLARVAGPPGRHRLHRVIAHDDYVVAEGKLDDGGHGIDFVDVVTFSADGLLRGQRRYHNQARA